MYLQIPENNIDDFKTIYIRSLLQKLSKELSKTYYKSTDWPAIRQINEGNPNLSFHNYFEDVEKMI